MDRLPDSLSIALWVVGSCVVLALAACAFGEPRELIVSLIAFGVLIGFAEWFGRRTEK